MNTLLIKNSDHRVFDWSLIASASLFICLVATSPILVNSLNWAVITTASLIYMGGYFRLISIDEIQLRYFITGSIPILLTMELVAINMPVAYLFIVYLAIYNGSFTINYILHARYFQLISLCLQILALCLVGLLIFNTNIHLELLDPVLAMKKTTAETLGKVVANELSKVKPPKLDPESLPAVLDTTNREDGFYTTERSNSELISVERNQSVLDRLSALSNLSSKTYSQLTEDARKTVDSTLSMQIKTLGGSFHNGSLSSPRLSNEVDRLIQNAIDFGPESPKVLDSAKKVAELYCAGQKNLTTLHTQEIVQSVGAQINRAREMKTVFCNYPHFPQSILELTTEVVNSKNPLKIWNLSDLLFSLNKTTNLGDRHLCGLVSNDYLESLTGLTKHSLLQRYPHLVDSDMVFAMLAQSNPSLNPNMDNRTILDYLGTVDGQRMDSNSRIIITKGFKDWAFELFSKKLENSLGDTAQNAHVVAKLIDFGLTPAKPAIMDMYVENEVLSWNSLVDHNPVLDIPVLGVLQEPLTQFYATNDINLLYNALDIVLANEESFRVIDEVRREGFNLNMDFEWPGNAENMKASCLDPKHINFKKSSVMGLDVLVHTLIYKTTTLSHQEDIGSLLSKAKANPEVWKKITESVQFKFHSQTHGNFIDHIQVSENLKQ